MRTQPFTLVSHHLCPYVQRAVITLVEKEIPHQRLHIELSDKPAWFLRISPLGRVPLLMAGDAVLFESAVICEYLDEVTPGSLHPADPLEKAHHRSWIEFGSTILDAIAGFYNAEDIDSFEGKRRTIADKWAWLERSLGDGPHFAGPRFHLVDAVYGPVFRYFDVFERIGDFGFFDETPKVRDWRAALADRASIRGAADRSYPERLMDFLRRRDSRLSSLVTKAA